MVHSGEGDAQDIGKGLRHRDSHQKRSHEPWTPRHGHRLQIFQAHPGFLQRQFQHHVDVLDVVPGGELRDHPSELLMDRHLGGDDVGQDFPTL